MGVQFRMTPCCNPKTRKHKQASIFIELADAKSTITNILVYVSGREIKNEYLILLTNSTNLTLMVISNYLLVIAVQAWTKPLLTMYQINLVRRIDEQG